MAKKVAVLAVNPVNGCGLFQYLEAFFENGISYKVFAVSDTKEIKTNSGMVLIVDDVIANLKGHEDEFDALVFSCGDAVPVFQQYANQPYNVDLMEVIKTFGEKGKMMIGHCAGAMMFDFTGITKGKKVAVHPLAKPAIQNGIATDEKSEIDGNFFTAQDENTIWTMLPKILHLLLYIPVIWLYFSASITCGNIVQIVFSSCAVKKLPSISDFSSVAIPFWIAGLANG